MIVARGLVKTYELGGQTVRALDGVSLDIESGELVALRGPSGSGKSTLMNIIGCLDRPDAGTYILAGDDVSCMPKNALADVRSRRIGFVFQNFNLLPRMTALQNVALPVLYAGGGEAKAKAAEALRIVGLSDRMKHKPSQLSGGQRQRVAVARAIVTDPAIILADEPTGALDSKTGEEILALFKSLNDQGRTIIIVTHDVNVARHCRRKIHIYDGRIVEAQHAAAVRGVAADPVAALDEGM